MSGRRILTISSSFFVGMFARGPHDAYDVVDDPLPADARIVNAQMVFSMQQDGGNVAVILESDEWPEVPAGERIPPVEPRMTRLHTPESPEGGQVIEFNGYIRSASDESIVVDGTEEAEVKAGVPPRRIRAASFEIGTCGQFPYDMLRDLAGRKVKVTLVD